MSLFGMLFKPAAKRDAERQVYEAAVSFVVESLRHQMATIDREGKALPPAASDDFSLGYLAGYVESLGQLRKLATDEAGYALYRVVFLELFGPRVGEQHFARFMLQQGKGDEAIAMGMRQGGDDLFAWLNGEKESPDLWASYVNRQ